MTEKNQTNAGAKTNEKSDGLDYAALGLLCGLEIHQQLEGKKLFSVSPTIIRDDQADFSVTRKLTPVAGETGEVDVAAKKESSKNKMYRYNGYKDSVSLVELDEQPPLPLNKEALYTALQVSMLLNANIVDEIHVMRKTVVDGSNTSGFQRTSLIARNGVITVGKEDVLIPSICLEEDSAKIESREHNIDTYNLSRLGIPLIEIATAPTIRFPQEAKDVALALGRILRSTGRVKRGLGTIRQDVNVSIKEGNRVEIKGAQDLELLPTIVGFEAQRQHTIAKLLPKLKKMVCKHIDAPIDFTDFFKKKIASNQPLAPFVAQAIQNGNGVYGVACENANGVLGTETQPGKRIGSDISDYAKVLTGLGGLIHSDEDLNKYKLTVEDAATIKKQVGAKENDAFILVVTTKDIAIKAFCAMHERIEMLKHGVPSEVRKANDDGTSSYLRPMPGAARMYPETDVWPIRPVTKGIVVPETIDVKIVRYQKEYGLGKDLAELVATGESFLLFEQSVDTFSELKPTTIAETISSLPVTVKRKHNVDVTLNQETFAAIFTALTEKTVSLGSLVDVAKDFAQTKDISASLEKFALFSNEKTESLVKEVIAELSGAPVGKIMGEVMRRSGGKVDGKLVQELVSKLAK